MSGKNMKPKSIVNDQSGAVLIVIAITLTVLMGMVAIALDIGHLAVVRNQVQNAADAGALAGARVLYTSVSGTTIIVNPAANEIASAVTSTNESDGFGVEARPEDITKGHWCFNCTGPDGERGVFTPNDAVTSFSLNTLNFADLDADPNYINAVRVIASRGPAIQAASYFARIFGHTGFSVKAEAVAWLGSAGSSFRVDQPLAICRQSMVNEKNEENCKGGKLINSNVETGAWTNLEQGATGCDGASSKTEVVPLICPDQTIPKDVHYGQPMSLVNGEVQPALDGLRNCWLSNSSLDSNSDHVPDHVWRLLLPMIDCDDPSPMCKKLIGAIDLEVYWITPNGNDPHFNRIPKVFYIDPGTGGPEIEYTCPATCSPAPCPSLISEEGRKLCWLKFLDFFKVTDGNNEPYTLENTGYTPNTIYFKPSCEFKHEGISGGAPSNVIAKIPKLVK